MKWKQFKRIGNLNRTEIWLLVRVAGILSILAILQKIFSLEKLLSLLQPDASGKCNRCGSAALELERIVYLTDRLLWQNFWVFRPVCLRRSLVLFRYLRQSGYPVSICFGVSNADKTLSGHSWLELDGDVIAERDEGYKGFQVTYRFP